MHPFYILIEVLKVLILKIYKIHPPVPIFLLFYIGFYTSADIIFHNFLKLYSTLSEKKNKHFVTKFLFLMDSLSPILYPHL